MKPDPCPLFTLWGASRPPRAILGRAGGAAAGGPGRAGGEGLLGTWESLAARPQGARPGAAAPRTASLRGVTASLPPPCRFDADSCTYYFSWDSRAACAVKPQEVQVVNGTITNPVNGKRVSLGDIYFK